MKVAFFHCMFGAAFVWYFIGIKNAIVAELGKFTDFVSYDHSINFNVVIVVISSTGLIKSNKHAVLAGWSAIIVIVIASQLHIFA